MWQRSRFLASNELVNLANDLVRQEGLFIEVDVKTYKERFGERLIPTGAYNRGVPPEPAVITLYIPQIGIDRDRALAILAHEIGHHLQITEEPFPPANELNATRLGVPFAYKWGVPFNVYLGITLLGIIISFPDMQVARLQRDLTEMILQLWSH